MARSGSVSTWAQQKFSELLILVIKFAAVMAFFMVPAYFTALKFGWIDWDITKIDWQKIKSDATSDTGNSSAFTQKANFGNKFNKYFKRLGKAIKGKPEPKKTSSTFTNAADF
uniref:Uncharacterized protein n=1 Tax=viral metagenome TaxID=1070528 RepID=A0A6C0KD76_9ZZZZ